MRKSAKIAICPETFVHDCSSSAIPGLHVCTSPIDQLCVDCEPGLYVSDKGSYTHCGFCPKSLLTSENMSRERGFLNKGLFTFPGSKIL